MNLEMYIGKVAHYRPMYSNELKEGVVVELKPLVSIGGGKITLFIMETGEAVLATSCYFDPSIDSAKD